MIPAAFDVECVSATRRSVWESMLTRILIVVSCHFAYFQYSDGTQSVVKWDYCKQEAEHKATVERKRREKRRKLAHRIRMAKVRARALLRALKRRKPKCLPGHRDAAARIAGRCR